MVLFMKIIIHDLDGREAELPGRDQDGSTVVISDNGGIRKCIGCFGCWIKTPGKCVLKDGYENMGELLAGCDRLVVVSRCVYGSYSPFVVNVLNRSISYLLPYFSTKNGETHHRNRYDNKFSLSVHFYGEDITETEKETARKLVAANSVNLYSIDNKVYFYNSVQAAVKEALK